MRGPNATTTSRPRRRTTKKPSRRETPEGLRLRASDHQSNATWGSDQRGATCPGRRPRPGSPPIPPIGRPANPGLGMGAGAPGPREGKGGRLTTPRLRLSPTGEAILFLPLELALCITKSPSNSRCKRLRQFASEERGCVKIHLPPRGISRAGEGDSGAGLLRRVHGWRIHDGGARTGPAHARPPPAKPASWRPGRR